MRRVVFDTSAVVSAVIFRVGQLAWLRAHWRDGECQPLISRETAGELTKVLRHRKFALTEDRFHESLAAYLPYCEIVTGVATCPVTCRDAKDQPFLALAHGGKAEALVSGDRDLIALAGKTAFRIETPAEYQRRVRGA